METDMADSGSGFQRQDQPLGSLMSDLIGNVQALLRGEIRLATAELKAEAKTAGIGGGLMAGGGLLALIGTAFIGQALNETLARFLPRWLAALLVAGLYLLGGALLFGMGRQRLRNLDPVPHRTIASLQEDSEMVRRELQPGES